MDDLMNLIGGGAGAALTVEDGIIIEDGGEKQPIDGMMIIEDENSEGPSPQKRSGSKKALTEDERAFLNAAS